jgi:predicted nucleic acid-binding protein
VFIVDTNVLSAMAPSQRAQHPALANWLETSSARIFISVVTASEISAGIVKAERLGAATKARGLRVWWDNLLRIYGERILPVDLNVAVVAGEMLDAARSYAPGYPDIAIAATAKVHDMTVLTRNERHFVPLGVRVIDPFIRLP